MYRFAKLTLFTLAVAAQAWLASSGPSAAVAEFDVVTEQKFNDWRMFLYKNRQGGRRFCAASTTARDGTLFRFNIYKDKPDAFVEFFNVNWKLPKAKVRFGLKADNGKALEVDGESWGDSLIHDTVDEKALKAMFDILLEAKSVRLLSPDNTELAQFSLDGIRGALRAMLDCSNAR